MLAKALRAKSLLWLGRQSYSLYLIHVPIILTVMVYFQGQVKPLVCVMLAAGCIGAAELFRRFVEAPSARLAGGLVKPRIATGVSAYQGSREVVPE